MITEKQAKKLIGARVVCTHSAKRGGQRHAGTLRGLDSDPKRALVEFDDAHGHVSQPFRELLTLVPDG